MSTKQSRSKGQRQKQRKASITSTTSQRQEKKIPLERRLNPKYVQEEKLIQQILETRKEMIVDINPSQSELEVLFFTGCIPNAADIDQSSVSQRSDNSHELQEETQTNFADSYVQIEEDLLFDRVRTHIEYDDSLLYHPSSEKPLIAHAKSDVPVKSEQGLYELPHPSIKSTNKYLLYNRLLEGEKHELFEPNGELKGLKSEQTDNKLYKYESEREFPIKFILTEEDDLESYDHLDRQRVLVIRVAKVHFNHHHLFAEETLLAKSIASLFQTYSEHRRADNCERYLQKIRILKSTMSDAATSNLNYEDKYQLRMEIRELRRKYHAESRILKNTSKQIIADYKKLKILRKNQQFNVSDLKLLVSVSDKDSDVSHRKKRHEEMFNEEVQELFEDEQLEYVERRRERRHSRRSLTADEVDNLPPLPMKPTKEGIRNKLQKMYSESHFDPAEPKIELYLDRIPKTPAVNNILEQKRLAQIRSTKFHLKVYLNSALVGALSNGTLAEDDFVVHFNSSVTIVLTTKLPEQIRVDLIEERHLKPKIKIAKMFIPVPTLREAFETTDWIQMDFTSKKNIQSDVGIGAGQSCLRNGQQQMIRGVIDLKLGWRGVDVGASSQFQSQLVLRNTDDSQIDPMNPEVRRRIRALDNLEANDESDGEEDDQEGDEFYFKEDELAFCSEEEMLSNPRRKILMERSRNNVKYRDMKLVPLRDRHIPETATEDSEKIIDETLGMDPIDLQRYKGKKYLTEVYSTITNHCKVLGQNDNDSLLTHEVPTFGSLSSAFWRLFGPNRPLKPTRRIHSRASCRTVDVSQFKVVVNIVRAFGIPHRQEDPIINQRKSSNMSSPGTAYRPANIRPFISATYKDVTVRTSTADGSNPTWNEQLIVPLNLKKLEEMKGFLIVQLFDEFVEDILEDDRNRLTDIYQRISNKWIGELRIPLPDIYLTQRIEGTFILNSPALLVGYSKALLRSPQGQSAAAYTNTNITTDFLRGAIYLTLLITLEPTTDSPTLSTKYLECTESDDVKSTMGIWMQDYLAEFPSRLIDPFVTLLNGKRVNIMNLVGPINLPFDASQSPEQSESMLRRYVSLIPVLNTIDPCGQLSGIWLLNDQVFSLLKCSTKDLAILLVNFYLKVNLEAWLMIGASHLATASCFVLLKEGDSEFAIIDPASGIKFQYTDTYCPLIKVHFLVNDKNIWGNIQVENKVFMSRYNVNDSSDWRPMFKKGQELPVGFLHERNFPFKPNYDFRNVQFMIELKLTKKFSQWRGHRKTTWNRYVRENLRKILIELEKDAVELKEPADHWEKLGFLHNNFRMSGAPLHMPYVNISHIVDHVKSVGIHLNTDPKVEFALSVYVHAYPQYVLSVWVFVMALLPK